MARSGGVTSVLALTLTPAPRRAAGAVAQVELRCDELGLECPARPLGDPLSDDDRAELAWYLEEYWQWPFAQFLRRGAKVEQRLPEIGRRLYQAVFGAPEAMALLQAWRLQPLPPGAGRQIGILSDVPAALSLPWELLHDEQGFLVLRNEPVTIVRRLPQRELAAFPAPFTPPLRVLLLTARPEDAGFVDQRVIARELLDEAQAQVEAGTLAIECLRPPTLQALRARLRDSTRPVHVLHFDGHGAFSEDTDLRSGLRLRGGAQGQLAFEQDDGRQHLVPAGDLAQVLQGSGVRLAVLTACQSAQGAADDAFSSVAARLIQGGVDAVAAMSASVLVASAARYAEGFYRALAAGDAAATAHERARQALHDDPRRHPLARRKHEEGRPVELRDWWLPHFYQQRALALHAQDAAAALPAPSAPRFNDDWPAPPRYGFSGRARELLEIERALVRGQVLVLHGFGGTGKSATACEAGAWLTRTGLYDAGLFVPFERGGDAVSLLAQLAHQLGAYDAAFDPRATRAAVARLKPALARRRTLVLADNFETLLPGGEAPLEAAARAELVGVLVGLAEAGAGVIVTTRDTAFGDARLLPGARVRHVRLGGLHAEDAYALATRLIEALGIGRERAPYAELRELLARLDHHPLALLLVLPALQAPELKLADITRDLAKLLPKFSDDTAGGRNRSLLASLDFSLRRLTEEQRTGLRRVAVFEGGASEDDLLAVTGMPAAEWAGLRPALEQAALVAAESVHADVTVPFLRFHPVLVPYLRAATPGDDGELRARFTARYREVATGLYYADQRHPHAARALFLRERPNLRRALALLLEEGDVEAASELLERMATFLTALGLERERDVLRGELAAALSRRREHGEDGLTQAEFLHESGLGEAELARGELGAAQARFTRLLARITRQPAGSARGTGSYEHCVTLHLLARCLTAGGQPAAARARLEEALAVIDALLAAEPEDASCRRQRSSLLTDLANVLADQGEYARARERYEQGLKLSRALGDRRSEAVQLGQLGTLALLERRFDEARQRDTVALATFRALDEPTSEATAWHQLGLVAQEQQQWDEAERCYRESLAIMESQGDSVGAAGTCNQLANVAQLREHPDDAERWYEHALSFAGLPDVMLAMCRNNLADLLLAEVRAGRAPAARLAEARAHAEQSLRLIEALDLSAQPWAPLNILAGIADLEGRPDEARAYRRRERETFAAFAGNRYHIDRQHTPFMLAAAAATQGQAQARAAVEQRLPKLEELGWHVAGAVRRLWAGERDWHALAEGLDRQDALLILRILETLQGQGPTPSEDEPTS